MKKRYILFIDSGIGGITTLAKTMKKLNANFLYFADNKFAPFGNKSETFLHERLAKIILDIKQKYSLKMVVLACNTATTTSISFLRSRFPKILFIGTEPATKMALDRDFSNPAIIATVQTIHHLDAKKCQNFTLIEMKNLATQIENTFSFETIKGRFELLKSIYEITEKTKHNDCIILGCTHYPLIKSRLEKLTGKNIFDGNEGVSNRIVSLYDDFHAKASLKIMLSARKKGLIQNYKKILNQILANQIKLW